MIKTEDFNWLREPQVQALLGLKRTTLYYMRKNNLIRWSQVGHTVFYDKASIEQYLDANASQISLTNLIIDSVENRMMDNERKKVLAFIEKQDNIIQKIETNINQIAKMVNGQKFISENKLQKFSNKLTEIAKLKAQQNEVFIYIYSMLGK